MVKQYGIIFETHDKDEASRAVAILADFHITPIVVYRIVMDDYLIGLATNLSDVENGKKIIQQYTTPQQPSSRFYNWND